MDSGTRTGIYFGTTSGVITTLGLVVGLNAGTGSLAAVLGGVLVIALADAMSDALGIHLAQEANANASEKQVWAATLSTFFAKFLTAMSFVVPFTVFTLQVAIYVSIGWGYVVISLLSYRLAREQGTSPFSVVIEHILIATIVLAASYGIGIWIRTAFAQ